MTEPIGKCKWCGEPLYKSANGNQKLFCGAKCRSKWNYNHYKYNEPQRRNVNESEKCKTCGAPTQNYYCSRKCSQRYYNYKARAEKTGVPIEELLEAYRAGHPIRHNSKPSILNTKSRPKSPRKPKEAKLKTYKCKWCGQEFTARANLTAILYCKEHKNALNRKNVMDLYKRPHKCGLYINGRPLIDIEIEELEKLAK
mgnify:CR=1 FL=1